MDLESALIILCRVHLENPESERWSYHTRHPRDAGVWLQEYLEAWDVVRKQAFRLDALPPPESPDLALP